jgi:hypothetical protein
MIPSTNKSRGEEAMAHLRLAQAGLAVASVVAVLSLSACGGGGGGSDAPLPKSEVKPTAQQAPSTQSVLQLQTADASVAKIAAAAPASLSMLTGLAGTWLPPLGDTPTADPAVIMPLAQAHWRNVSRAAQGTLSTQANSLATQAEMAAFLRAPLGALDRQVWGQRDHLFNNSFLSDLGLVSSVSAVHAYAAAPLDFALSQELASADFSASITGTIGLSGWTQFAPRASTRLVQFDRGVWTWPLQGGQAIEAIVSDNVGRLYQTASTVWRDQVRAVAGADYAAQVLGQKGAERILYIVPTNGSLFAWSPVRLSQVVDEAVAASSSDSATAGELILPLQTHALKLRLSNVVKGLEQAFDPLRADLRGLDLQGGTYLKSLDEYASLDVLPEGLQVEARAGLAFVHDPRNPFQGTGGSSSSFFQVNLGLMQGGKDQLTLPLCGDAPTLRPGYLVLLAEQRQLMAVVAFTPRATGGRCR